MNLNYTQFTTNLTCSVIMPCFHSSNHAVETNMFALCRNVYDHSISYMCNIEYDQTSLYILFALCSLYSWYIQNCYVFAYVTICT